MGLMTSITKLKEEIIHSDCAHFTARFTYDTITSLVDQLSALPRVMYSAVTHLPTQKVMNQLIQTALLEITPIVIASFITDQFKKNTYDYMENDSVENNLVLYYLCLSTVYLTVLANFVWQVNHQSKLMASSTILGIGAPAKFKSELDNFQSEICSAEHCSALRVGKGIARDNATYIFIELLTKITNFIPWIGALVSRYFSIMNSGQYVLSIALPECFRHQCIFFQEYPGQVFGQGLGVLLSTKGLAVGIEAITRFPGYGLEYLGMSIDTSVPKEYYEPFLFSLMLVLHMSIALHMRFPERLASSEKVIIDPVLYIKSKAGNYFDIKVSQLKEKIIQKARQTSNKDDIWLIIEQKWRSEKTIFMKECSERWRVFSKKFYIENASLENAKLLMQKMVQGVCDIHLLPETLLSLDGLFSHPVIGSYMAEWLGKTITGFDKLDEYKKYWLLRLVHQLFPQEFKGALGKKLLGIPKEVVNFLFRIIYSPYVTMHLVHLEDFLKTLQLRHTALIEVGAASPKASQYGFFKPKDRHLELLGDALLNSINDDEDNSIEDENRASSSYNSSERVSLSSAGSSLETIPLSSPVINLEPNSLSFPQSNLEIGSLSSLRRLESYSPSVSPVSIILKEDEIPKDFQTLLQSDIASAMMEEEEEEDWVFLPRKSRRY